MLDLSHDELRKKLDELKKEHAALDARIESLGGGGSYDLQVARLKRQKLLIKDEIERLRNMVTPDIIA